MLLVSVVSHSLQSGTLVIILYDVLDVVLVGMEVQFLYPCPDISGVFACEIQ